MSILKMKAGFNASLTLAFLVVLSWMALWSVYISVKHWIYVENAQTCATTCENFPHWIKKEMIGYSCLCQQADLSWKLQK
jgi:disulfide bond formation protein DsbB